MRKSFVLLAVIVCVALAFTPLMADRTADRSKASQRTVTTDDDRTSIHPAVRHHPGQWRTAGDISAANRAGAFMAQAATAQNNDLAIAALMQAVRLGADDEKLLAEAYARLGDLYEGNASKQVHLYSLAMQYTSDPGVRAQLQRQITSLGGDVYDLASTSNNQSLNTRTCGYADTCDVATAITLDAYLTGLYIENWLCTDHDWYTFDVPGPDGWAVRIETITNNPPYYDDTDLTLWGGCDAGAPSGQLYFNDDGGAYFMSLIQTECLAPGTYYIQVGGFFDISSADNFDMSVEVTETCILPDPDGYEPDDDRDLANAIGLPTSVPSHANGWGRAKSEIQDHTIYPPFDWDHVKFGVNRSERVTMTIAQQFPTFFNDFESIPAGYDVDSYIEVLYGVEPNYGGLCNDPDIGFDPFCKSDEDCPPPVGTPLPGYPTCIPIYYFTFGGAPLFYIENPLAYNDDAWGSIGYGSQLNICLPRSDQQTPSLTADGDWILRMLSSPVYAPSDTFFYQVQVKNEYACLFEQEPNNGPIGANPLPFFEVQSGFQEYSAFLGNGGNGPWQGLDWIMSDPDWFYFDVDGVSEAWFATDGYHSYLCDTALDLYVGPDDFGNYYWTGIWDDDSGPGWLSLLGVIMPPADELLGNEVADANYFLDVTSMWINGNFPWDLYSTVVPYVAPTFEVEPNDTCETGNAVDVGDTVVADINPTCDFDAFNLTLTEARYIVFETDGSSGDTTMHLENAAGDYLGCDDDGGAGLFSKIEGCLPAGDYCANIRAYSAYSTISGYEFSVSDMGSCVPTDPPTTMYDERYRCDGYGYTSPTDEFFTCP